MNEQLVERRENEREAALATIDQVLNAIDAQGREPDDWERTSLVDAFKNIFHGAYRLALASAELALVPPRDRSPAQLELDMEFQNIDLAALRLIAAEARLQPLLKQVIFGRIEIR